MCAAVHDGLGHSRWLIQKDTLAIDHGGFAAITCGDAKRGLVPQIVAQINLGVLYFAEMLPDQVRNCLEERIDLTDIRKCLSNLTAGFDISRALPDTHLKRLYVVLHVTGIL